jgi:hypothetical protein
MCAVGPGIPPPRRDGAARCSVGSNPELTSRRLSSSLVFLVLARVRHFRAVAARTGRCRRLFPPSLPSSPRPSRLPHAAIGRIRPGAIDAGRKAHLPRSAAHGRHAQRWARRGNSLSPRRYSYAKFNSAWLVIGPSSHRSTSLRIYLLQSSVSKRSFFW